MEWFSRMKMSKVPRPDKNILLKGAWDKWLSSNDIPIEEGQIVIYSTGQVLEKCVIRRIGTTPYHRPSGLSDELNPYYMPRGNISIELLNPGPRRRAGHCFHVKAACRLWVLNETVTEHLTEQLKLRDPDNAYWDALQGRD